MNTPRHPTERSVVKLKEGASTCILCHAKELCLASCLSQDSLAEFNDVVGHRAPMRRGECLYMAGDQIQSIFVLHSGSVKSYVNSMDGDVQITGFHFAGDIIGIHGIEDRVHTDTIEGLETSSVCEIRFKNIDELTNTFPGLQSRLMRFVFREMSHEQEMLMVLGQMSAERRVAHFLLDISQRMAERDLSPLKINLTMTRNDIGNYLGLAVETISRIFTRFQALNIIEVERRRIRICDMGLLEATYDNSFDPGKLEAG